MRLLFVKPQLIGDTLILTPVLRAVKRAYPDAEIWVLVRRGCEGILAGCPEVDRILTIAAINDRKHTVCSTWQGLLDIIRLRSVRFDYVFELSDQHRGRLFALLTRARRRCTTKVFGEMKSWIRWRIPMESTFVSEMRHRVEKDYYSVSEFLPGMEPTPPPLVFDQDLTQDWPGGPDLKRFCLLQVGTWKANCRWPRDRWKEVAEALLKHHDHVVISTGPAPHEIEDALWLQEHLGSRSVCTLGKTSWAQVAGLLYRAELYVGLDTAAMHVAAACQCPIVALFSTTEDRWLPWKAGYRRVMPEIYRSIHDPVQLRKFRREPRPDEIEARDVIKACEEMILLGSRKTL